MKGQARLEFRSRRKAASAPSSEITNNKVIIDSTKAFRPIEIPYEPTKVEKPKPVERKSGRIAKNMKQTVLDLKRQEESDINAQKRKSDITLAHTTKKQKTLELHADNVEESVTSNTEEDIVEQHAEIVKESLADSVKQNTDTKLIEEERVTNIVKEDSDTKLIEEERVTNIVKEDTDTKLIEQESATDIVKQNTDTKLIEQEMIVQQEIVESVSTAEVDFFETSLKTDTALDAFTPTHAYDSPSPPSFLTEPSTPPVHLEDVSAPYKTCMTSTDRLRIENEKTTLEKLRKALDIVITDRMARSKPTLYHQVEPVLRNSTRKDITLSHVCKVMYLAPNLYTLEAKELRDFGGKVTEAFALGFTNEWVCPLVGKDLQQRSDILKDSLKRYFETHREPDATVPEMKLPRLSLVVDKEDWINNAHLPAGIKALLESHKKISEAEEESKKPKPKPVGSVKDRMAALRARLAKKNAS